MNIAITFQITAFLRTILPYILSNILMSPYPGVRLEKKFHKTMTCIELLSLPEFFNFNVKKQ